MRNFFFGIFLLCALHSTSWAQQRVPKYGIYEITLSGPTAGNPDANLELSATFKQGDKTYRPEGFYDGNGVYKIRFMPAHEGEWTYTTHSNYAELNNKTGALLCIESKNRGPVRVANTYHFAYADGSRFYPFGTTIYEWAFQPEARKLQTLETLKGTAFNKVRMLAVPPYKPYYVQGPNKLTQFPYVGTAKENFDFSRFNPAYFQSLERDVQRLSDLGIQVDLILFRPYDKGLWGFDTTNDETNRRFVKHMVARFAAFQNIWWSLANENSYIKHLSDEDFDHYFQLVQKFDPYNHLRSIHNADRLYDYNKPWVTHVSLQYYNAVKVFGVSPLLRDIYKKPIVHDEINYEGNSASRWGQLSGEELTRRFWIALTGGAYATHGEIIDNGWIGGGGKLDGSSPQRIAFLRKIVESGPAEGLTPIDQAFVMNAAGKAGDYYLYYFGDEQPKEWAFALPQRELRKGMRFQVDVIDTWNMTISRVPETFELTDPTRYTVVDKDKRVVKLPGKPFMALRIQRIGAPMKPLNEKKSSEIVEDEL